MTAAYATPLASMPRLAIVDDDEILLRSTSRLLRRAFDVKTYSTVAAFLADLATGPAPDVLLFDRQLQDGSGEGLVHQLAADRRGLLPRVVLMTGGSAVSVDADVRRLVSNRVVEKPFDGAAMTSMLLRVADES